jgi:iron complex transport system ATP-binding protein
MSAQSLRTPGRHATAPRTPALQAQDVHVAYRRRDVLHGVDLALERGRVHGLVGPNGAGKSTLLRALTGLTAPSGGVVRSDGRDVAALGSRERARRITFLPQDTQIGAGLSVETVVGLGRYAHHGLLTRMQGDLTAEDREAVETSLARVGAEHLRERRIDRLSGGQRQLVLIAKQLAQDAEVMLLDEPVSALDLGYQLDVVELLRELAAAGRAIGVVLHDLDLAACACDDLTLLADGRVLAAGSPHEVLRPELLAAAYRIRADVDRDPLTGRPRITPRGRLDRRRSPSPHS